MLLNMLKSKIHRAIVTEAKLNYVGSITIDENLMDAANIIECEKVQVVDVNNGSRFETYVIPGERGSGVVCINGAAARHVQPGDHVILMTYCLVDEKEAKAHKPVVIFVNHENYVIESTNYERHGEIK